MRFKRRYMKRYDSTKKKKIKVMVYYINNQEVSKTTFLNQLGEHKRSTFLCESINGKMYYKRISKYEYREISSLSTENIHFMELEGIEYFDKQVGKGKLMVIRKKTEISVLEDRQINDEGIAEFNQVVKLLIVEMIDKFKLTDLKNFYIRPALTFSAIVEKNVYSVKSEFTYSVDSATHYKNIEKNTNLVLNKVFQKSSILALGIIYITLFAMETGYYANTEEPKN